MNFDILQWPYAFGGPAATGRLKQEPEDFVVDEVLGFEPDGQGEHLFLKVRKRGANTDWVAQELARFAGIRPDDVSYAGLKDRHAVTTQWFSVHLPGAVDPDFSALASTEFTVLEARRHGRKLRRGVLQGNRFELRVQALSGEFDGVSARLEQLKNRGAPNYFGAQRFGRDGGNLHRAEALFAGRLRERNRTKRGLYLSAARSWLFNGVLAERVRRGNWDQGIPGECFMLDGSHSFFVATELDEALAKRAMAGDIHPTGPLWGRGRLATQLDAEALEREVVAPYAAFCEGLEKEGMQQERRPLRVPLRDLTWSLDGDTLEVAFFLPAGSYATAVMREIISAAEAVD